MANNKVEYVLTLKDLFTGGIKKATNETNKLDNAINKTKKDTIGLGSALAGLATGLIVGEVVRATAAMEGLRNQLNFVSGSAQQGGEDLEYLRTISKEMGLDLQTSAKAFTSFSAAARGTKLQGQGVKDIFEGVGMASTVMHLSAEQSEGAFLALTQMMSKGKVQAEELRGQLGERIPGAFQIAARAMNMTTGELDKFMQDGKLLSEEFLPKFAMQLKTEFAGGMEVAGQSLTANLNRMNTAFFELKTTVGEVLMPVIKGFISAILVISKWISENKVLFTFLISSFATLAAIIAVTTAAQWALNTAMAFAAGLTGVGWIGIAAAGAAALAVGLYAANSAQESLNKSMANGVTPVKVNPMGAASNQISSNVSTGKTKAAGTDVSGVEARGHQNFNISIDSLIETLNISTTNLRDSSAKIKAEVTKALIESVNDWQLLATK